MGLNSPFLLLVLFVVGWASGLQMDRRARRSHSLALQAEAGAATNGTEPAAGGGGGPKPPPPPKCEGESCLQCQASSTTTHKCVWANPSEPECMAGSDATNLTVVTQCPVDDWRQVPGYGTNSPSARKGASMTLVKDQLIIFGGCYLDVTCYNDVYFYKALEGKWSPVSETFKKSKGVIPKARGGHTASLVGDVLFMFGGSSKSFLNDLVAFNTVDYRWFVPVMSGDAPTARHGHSAITYKKKIFIWGGYSDTGYLNDLWILDTELNTWQNPVFRGKELPKARMGHSATLFEKRGEMLVFGGTANTVTFSDAWILNLDTLAWLPVNVTGKPIAARHGHVAALYKEHIFISGGCDIHTLRCYADQRVLDLPAATPETENNRGAIAGYPIGTAPPRVVEAAQPGAAPAPSLLQSDDNKTVSSNATAAPAAGNSSAPAAANGTSTEGAAAANATKATGPAKPQGIEAAGPVLRWTPRGFLCGHFVHDTLFLFGGSALQNECYADFVSVKAPETLAVSQEPYITAVQGEVEVEPAGQTTKVAQNASNATAVAPANATNTSLIQTVAAPLPITAQPAAVRQMAEQQVQAVDPVTEVQWDAPTKTDAADFRISNDLVQSIFVPILAVILLAVLAFGCYRGIISSSILGNKKADQTVLFS